MVLQKLGKDEACRRLRAALNKEEGGGVPVSNLCRLLFKAKKDSTFRRAGIGAVRFLGGTSYEDWPLDPFKVVDGVPFVITDGSLHVQGVVSSRRCDLVRKSGSRMELTNLGIDDFAGMIDLIRQQAQSRGIAWKEEQQTLK